MIDDTFGLDNIVYLYMMIDDTFSFSLNRVQQYIWTFRSKFKQVRDKSKVTKFRTERDNPFIE